MTAWLRIGLPLAALIVILSLVIAWQRASNTADRLTREVKVANATIDQQQKRIGDLERQNLEKLADDTAIDKAKEELTDAIKDIPAGVAPGPAAVAAGCVRLRQAGATSSDAFKRICGAR